MNRTDQRAIRQRPLAMSLVAIAVLVGAIGCQPSAPGGDASPTLAPVATSVPGPSLGSPSAPVETPTPAPASTPGAVFDTISVMPDGQNELPISLLDQTGLVTGIEALPADGGFEDGVEDAVEGTGLIYSWTGGACDSRTLLTFERTESGFRLLTLTETTGDLCILIAIGRRIAIHLSEPIDAATVTVVPGQP